MLGWGMNWNWVLFAEETGESELVFVLGLYRKLVFVGSFSRGVR